MKLKIMSFNVQHCENFITKEIDYESIINLIKKYDPDIVGLNEVFGKGFDRSISNNQAEYIANKLGYYYFFAPATTINFKKYGNAILSKLPIKNEQIVKIPYPFFKRGNKLYQKRNIIKININDVTVLATHLGLNEDEQINGLNAILKSIDNEKTILLGDFNVNNDNQIINLLKKELKCTSKTNYCTYPSNKPNRQLDYIFVSNDIIVKSCKTIREIVSDHLPIIAYIETK